MIKLIPFVHPNAEALSDSEIERRNFVNNIANKNIAVRLQDRVKENKCDKHPDFINQIIIDLSGGENIGRVDKYCCEEFKVLLDLIAQNKVPPGW